jgi:hypothetical protein
LSLKPSARRRHRLSLAAFSLISLLYVGAFAAGAAYLSSSHLALS